MRTITLVRCTVSVMAMSLAATAVQAQQTTTTTTSDTVAESGDAQGGTIIV